MMPVSFKGTTFLCLKNAYGITEPPNTIKIYQDDRNQSETETNDAQYSSSFVTFYTKHRVW